MKKLIMGTMLATLFASPALAQSYSPGFGTGNVIDLPALEHGGSAGPFGGPNAYEPPHVTRLSGIRAQAMSPSDSDTVYNDGHYVGQDPDPNVRLGLRRDSGMYN